MPWTLTKANTCTFSAVFVHIDLCLISFLSARSAKLNQKHSIMSPFDITNKILGPYVYSPTSRETLGDKMEYYFQDHSFMPLFIQENYLKTAPARSRNLDGVEKTLKDLRLMERASAAISDGDLVDSLIHGCVAPP